MQLLQSYIELPLLKDNGKINSSVSFTSKVVSLRPHAEIRNDGFPKEADLGL